MKKFIKKYKEDYKLKSRNLLVLLLINIFITSYQSIMQLEYAIIILGQILILALTVTFTRLDREYYYEEIKK